MNDRFAREDSIPPAGDMHNPLKLHWFGLQHVGCNVWRKILKCFPQKKLNYFSTEERKTWTSWMAIGWV